jgi:hypothetical protein
MKRIAEMLQFFVDLAICTNKKLSKEQKADALVKLKMGPHYIPVLIGLNLEEVHAFVKKYKGAVNEAFDKILVDMPKLYDNRAIIAGEEKKIFYMPDSETRNGYQRIFGAKMYSEGMQQLELNLAAISFTKALISHPEYVDAFVGMGVATSFMSVNALEMLEWFAKAYVVDPNFTIRRLIDLKFISIIQEIHKAVTERMQESIRR